MVTMQYGRSLPEARAQRLKLNAHDVGENVPFVQQWAVLLSTISEESADTMCLSWATAVEKGDCPLKETENAMTQMISGCSHCH